MTQSEFERALIEAVRDGYERAINRIPLTKDEPFESLEKRVREGGRP